MINTVKKNKTNRPVRQTDIRAAGYSVRYTKYSVLIAALFLTACQTISEPGEPTPTANDELAKRQQLKLLKSRQSSRQALQNRLCNPRP